MSSNALHVSDFSSYTISFLKHLLPNLFNCEDTNFYKSVLMTLSIPQLVQACYYQSEYTSLVFQNLTNLDLCGVIQVGSYYCQICTDEKKVPQLILCNDQNHSMVILKENEQHQLVEWIVCDPNNQTILDLDPTGRRWEGSVIDGVPCGYGVEYDDRDEISREGFVFQGQLVCWGYENYPNSSSKKYCGQYFAGQRYGRGVMYDLQNAVEYNGQWQFDQPKTVGNVKTSLPFLDITTTQVELLGELSVSLDNFILSSLFLNLTSVLIDSLVINSLKNFTLENLPSLTQVAIVYYRDDQPDEKPFFSPYIVPKYPFKFHPPYFCGTGLLMTARRHDEEREEYLERSIQSKCCIRNCPVLSQIDMRGYAFNMFSELSLASLPSLQSIYMGGKNFEFANSFVLKGIFQIYPHMK